MHATKEDELPIAIRLLVFWIGMLAALLHVASWPGLGSKDGIIVDALLRNGTSWRAANLAGMVVFALAAGTAILGAIIYAAGRRTFLKQYEVHSLRRAFRPYIWIALGYLVIVPILLLVVSVRGICGTM